MSDRRTIDVGVELSGDLIVEADFGQTVTEIVAPEHYLGPFEFQPSEQDQVIPVKDKTPVEDITIKAIKMDPVTITENGDYFPPPSQDGFSEVVVDVPATGYDEGTLIYEGDFSTVTSQWAVTKLPDGSVFSFDKIEVELQNLGQGTNSGWRQYWRGDLPMTGNQTYMLSGGVRYYGGATALRAKSVISVDDDTYITLTSIGFDADNPVNISADAKRARHGGYDKITGYGWWSWNCPAGAHIKITGYNRTS